MRLRSTSHAFNCVQSHYRRGRTLLTTSETYKQRLRKTDLSQLESLLKEIEDGQDSDVYQVLLDGVCWKAAERRVQDEIYMRGFGQVELPFSDKFSARVARPEWQRFIALRLISTSPIHENLRSSIVHLNLPRLPLSQMRLPDLTRFPNLRSLHLYLDEKPLNIPNLGLPNLEELSLFGPGFTTLSGLESAHKLRELDIRWNSAVSLEPLANKEALKVAKLTFHEGGLDLTSLSSTGIENAWVYGPELHTDRLLEAPKLRDLKITTESDLQLGAQDAVLERLSVDRARNVVMGEAPNLKEFRLLGSHPNGLSLKLQQKLPKLELLELIAFSAECPDFSQCPALRYLKARPLQTNTFEGLEGIGGCLQLREAELWQDHPDLPELSALPRLQRIEPRLRVSLAFDTKTRSLVESDDLGEELEEIFHSETDFDRACHRLLQWLEKTSAVDLLSALLEESKITSEGQIWVPPGSYLRGNPEERFETWDWSERPQTSASYRQAFVRFLLSKTETPREISERTDYQEVSEHSIELAHLSVYQSLEKISLSAPEFHNLSELRQLKNLKFLTLDGYLGEDLKFLSGCENLQELDLRQSRKIAGLASLQGISTLGNLRRLELRVAGNPDLKELSKTQIEELVLLTGDVPKIPKVATLKCLRCPDI